MWFMAVFRSVRRFLGVLLIVLLVLLLVAVVLSPLLGPRGKARIGATALRGSQIATALAQFKQHAGRFPTTHEGLNALIEQPISLDETKWHGPYLEAVPRDGYSGAFYYRSPDDHAQNYDLISAGRDGIFHTSDDKSNFRVR